MLNILALELALQFSTHILALNILALLVQPSAMIITGSCVNLHYL